MLHRVFLQKAASYSDIHGCILHPRKSSKATWWILIYTSMTGNYAVLFKSLYVLLNRPCLDHPSQLAKEQIIVLNKRFASHRCKISIQQTHNRYFHTQVTENIVSGSLSVFKMIPFTVLSRVHEYDSKSRINWRFRETTSKEIGEQREIWARLIYFKLIFR